MAKPDVARVQEDLQRLQQTLGLDSSVDDAAGHALIAVSGVASLIWTALTPPQWHFVGLLSILLPVAYTIMLRVRHRASAGGSPMVRREFSEGLGVLALALPIAVYAFWARYLQMPLLLILATVMFFVGVMIVGGAPRQRVLLCWGLAIMAGALLIPLHVVSPVGAIAIALIAGGSISALIVRRQAAASA